ncbi:MAG: prephenate dehydratase domain-containing protein [Sedimentibacter sp.]|uniref:prephenate dehydratase n=1 Tax=Sedimentibacter sp. TaxID=1960295 RepID=UPI0029812E49|nr:prephenate dehydratase domain-containing protein [Sedimentibacter sp.]MDW5299720.1 prephenate dehydratase domain-containing protein [Sedimentibacter sp.]
MEYNYLMEQIKENDEAMKDLFIKRMAMLEKISLIENKKCSNSNENSVGINNETESLLNNKYSMEYNCFMKNLLSIENKNKYNLLLNRNDIEKIQCSEIIKIQNVCYQGLPYSYSESAAKALFKNSAFINKPSFEEVFKTVYGGAADVGVVPIENSTAGYINEVYDLLLKYDLYINYTYVKKVDHCLAGVADAAIEDITEVYSHPQAILQCKEYIARHGIKHVEEINTAVAARNIAKLNDKHIACICSTEAAINYGLKIIDKQINQQKNNYTRFAAISKKLIYEEDHNRISIVFNVPHKIGSLDEVLSLFTYYNCNLSYIYSRPNLRSPLEYMFYLDFEGNISNNNIKSILYQLKNELPFMKILGSFKA